MSNYDLSKLYIRIDLCPEGEKLTNHFPELGAFSEFLVCDEDRIRIAILTADIDSPFVRIKDREAMIQAIFQYLDIDIEKNESQFKDIVKYRDHQFMNA